MQRVELRPQYIGLERQGGKGAPLLFDGASIVLDVVERKLGVLRRLIEPAAEIGDHFLVDEVVISFRFMLGENLLMIFDEMTGGGSLNLHISLRL